MSCTAVIYRVFKLPESLLTAMREKIQQEKYATWDDHHSSRPPTLTYINYPIEKCPELTTLPLPADTRRRLPMLPRVKKVEKRAGDARRHALNRVHFLRRQLLRQRLGARGRIIEFALFSVPCIVSSIGQADHANHCVEFEMRRVIVRSHAVVAVSQTLLERGLRRARSP